jgi:H+/Cl- antiporter ClcA
MPGLSFSIDNTAGPRPEVSPGLFGTIKSHWCAAFENEWTSGLVISGAIFIGGAVGLLVAALQQILFHLIDLVWVKIPEAICPHSNSCPGSMWVYNIIAIVILWVLAGVCMYLFQFPGPETPGMPVLINAVHTTGIFHPKSGADASLIIGAILRIWVVNFFFITGATSIGPEVQCMLTGALFSSWFSSYFGQSKYARTSRVLLLCGMASGLACFFSLPTSSVIFALEIPTRGLAYVEGISAVLAASVTACLVNASVQGAEWGGQLNLGDISVPATNVNLLLGLVCGILGFLPGRCFLFAVHYGKEYLTKFNLTAARPYHWIGSIAVFAALTGALSAIDPYSMFYAETEIATIVTLGQQPLPHYSRVLYGLSQIGGPDPTYLSSWELFVTGVIKTFNTAVCACYFPGGVIWPLYYAGMCIGAAWGSWFKCSPHTVLLYMLATGVATEVAALKNPLGAAVVMVMQISSSQTPAPISSAVEACAIAGFISWFLTYHVPYFPPSLQKPRQEGDFFDFMEIRKKEALLPGTS